MADKFRTWRQSPAARQATVPALTRDSPRCSSRPRDMLPDCDISAAILAAAALAATSLDRRRHADAQGGPFRFSVTLPPTLSSAVDGRLLVIVSRLDEGEPRFQVTTAPTGQPVFGIDVENWAGAEPATIDGAVARLPARQHQRHSRRHLHGAGAAPPLRDLQARRRPHGEDADGSRRGPAVGAGAGQSLLDAEDGRVRSAQGRHRSRSRSTR